VRIPLHMGKDCSVQSFLHSPHPCGSCAGVVGARDGRERPPSPQIHFNENQYHNLVVIDLSICRFISDQITRLRYDSFLFKLTNI